MTLPVVESWFGTGTALSVTSTPNLWIRMGEFASAQKSPLDLLFELQWPLMCFDVFGDNKQSSTQVGSTAGKTQHEGREKEHGYLF